MKAWRLIIVPFLISLFLSVPSHSKEIFYRVKRVVEGDTLFLTNGERVRLIGVGTPEVHESEKLYRDAKRSGGTLRP
jgi:micrococcal nuclease